MVHRGLAALSLLLIFALFPPAQAGVAEGIAAADQGDYATALAEFKAAAEAGAPDAIFYIGVMHDGGFGVDRDLTEAARWYERAAELGISEAQLNIGIMYGSGEGVERDLVRAHMWFVLAQSQGVEQASANIAIAERDMTLDQIGEAQRLAAEHPSRKKTPVPATQ